MAYNQSPGRMNMPKTGRGVDTVALMTGSPANQNLFDYIKKGAKLAAKVGRTALRTAGDVGMNVLDYMAVDPKNVGNSGGGSFSLGGARQAQSEAFRSKDMENRHYNTTRKLVKEGKIFDMGTADRFDDSGHATGSWNEERNTSGYGGLLENGKRNPNYKGGNVN